jgi:BolA family transcriptional regulator, general stress-responsive regulator
MLDTLPKIIAARLAPLEPTILHIQDDSALHQGHAGNRLGGAHYTLTIASAKFSGLTMLACHRLIYAQLTDLFPTPLHALAIKISQSPAQSMLDTEQMQKK